jgi:hypothetical protein
VGTVEPSKHFRIRLAEGHLIYEGNHAHVCDLDYAYDCDWARGMLFPLASARGNAARGSTTAEITTVKALAQQGGHLLSGSR